MDLQALLATPPFTLLDEAFRTYALDALGSPCDSEEAVEVLGPYLIDAGLAADDDEVRRLVGCGAAPVAEGPSLLAAPVSITELNAAAHSEPEFVVEEEVATQATSRISAARQAAHDAEAVKAARAPGAVLELNEDASAISRTLRSDLGDAADVAAASLAAYAEERRPERLGDWTRLLAEVLEDTGLADEELASRAVDRLISKGLLRAKSRDLVVGDVVLAVLPEDGEWHEAVVEGVGQKLKLVFVEYGRPLEVPRADVRAMDDVVDDDDDGELREGSCEMCERVLLLTFHHLIPKDKHPTYLGKRLPRGIEGEPTRGFLNSYGLMICRPCHNTVHRIGPNELLANEYNTLAKVMAHPMVQRWVEYNKRQRVTRRAH